MTFEQAKSTHLTSSSSTIISTNNADSKLYPLPRIGVAVLVFQQEKVLLGKRKSSHGKDLWACPGGHIEPGETIEECAKRELYEETCLAIESYSRGPWTDNIIDTKHYITCFIIVHTFSGTLHNNEPEKCSDWQWFSMNELPNSLFPTVKEYFTKQKSSSTAISTHQMS